MPAPLVGILALQGSSHAHQAVFAELSVPTRLLTSPADLLGITALVIPGGESTTLSLLLKASGLTTPLASLIATGFPVFATCAGAVLLTTTLPCLDVTLTRNAYGPQASSFEATLPIPALGPALFPGVFIRAPRLTHLAPTVTTLTSLAADHPVLVRQGNLLVATFHPELTADLRLHRYFLDIIQAPSVS
jgi:5'-phosphate synthase pdxT subunit